MELRHLRYFVAVGEALNFTKAAAKLRVAQPALSRQVQDLEDEIGVDLLKRSPRGVTLTAEGKLFLDEARETLRRVEASVNKVRALARGEFGELHVGYSPSPTVEVLPPALAAFQKSVPGVKVILHDLASDELCAGVRGGALELAVMVQPSEEAAAGFEFEELRRYPFYVAMNPRHALARMKTIPVEQLAGESLAVLRPRDYSEYHRLLNSILAAHRIRPRIAAECDSVDSLITGLQASSNVTVMSRIFQLSAGKRLVFRPLTNTTVMQHVGIVRAKLGDVTPAGEKFCAALRKASATDD